MSEEIWPCPSCGTKLTCQSSDIEKNFSCCNCKFISCPADHFRTVAMSLFIALARQEQQVPGSFRQMVRGFYAGLLDASKNELMELLDCLRNLMRASAGTVAEVIVDVLVNVVEVELDARVRETAWDDAKRLVRRGARATGDWLRTDDGKLVAEGTVVIAALLGFHYLRD